MQQPPKNLRDFFAGSSASSSNNLDASGGGNYGVGAVGGQRGGHSSAAKQPGGQAARLQAASPPTGGEQQQQQPSSSSSSANSPPSSSSSSSLDKSKVSSLEALVKKKDALLSSLASSHSSTVSSLQSQLSSLSSQADAQHRSSVSQLSVATNVVEALVVKAADQDAEKARRKITDEELRLGKITYGRVPGSGIIMGGGGAGGGGGGGGGAAAANGAFVGVVGGGSSALHETWEDGYASRRIKDSLSSIRDLKVEMEKRVKEARKIARKVVKDSGSARTTNTTNANANEAGRADDDEMLPPPSRGGGGGGGADDDNNADYSSSSSSSSSQQPDDLEAMEAEESARLHLAQLKKRESDLLEEERVVDTEKVMHLRALKLLASEDASRFVSRPKLHGRYCLQRLLGKGGFSEVWKAFDLQALREVAVKIHQLDFRWSEEKKRSYTRHVSREYEIHKSVRHPRIVSLLDVFEIDHNSFATVLEYCEGTDLDTMLKEQKVLNERDARAILLQILLGMRYLNTPASDGSRQGIIHYDLKPGNILFDSYGDAKITDFGLSKIVDSADGNDSLELTSQGAGTYWYLPPECFVTNGSVRISNKVDVWSIGVIFYQMLFGKRPFGDGQSQDKVLSNHTMLNARDVKFPAKPIASKEAKDFLQLCLTSEQSLRPDINQLCESPYLRMKKI